MRNAIALAAAAAALTAIAATGAQAEEWCGYGAHAKSIIECGYSSNTQCENAIGKGGMCFVDPDYALNARRAVPGLVAKPVTGRS